MTMDSLRLTPAIIIGLKIFFYQATFLLGFYFIPEALSAEINAITPDRTITVVVDQPDIPGWKILWDEARKKVQENRYFTASKIYHQLFKIKPNIEEANWEFCQVLLKVEDFSSAEKIIGSLIEKDPFRIDYLLAAGLITLQQKNYILAVKFYGKAYELDPDGIHSTSALTGFIDSLKGNENDEIVLPLLELLHVRDPENFSRLHELARLANSLGKTKKARAYYAKLLDRGPVEDRILFQAAELFEETGSKGGVVPLWQEYIRRNPNYLPFRYKLVQFYQANDEGMAALPHLLFIADKVIDNDPFQLQIAEIYLHDAGRPDKALSYYERYLLKNPDNQIVKSNIANIQSILANDFLSIVENDGAWLLWRDLMEVTPNRLAIYLEMATLLEKKEKFEELLEILLIISIYDPGNDEVNYKIAALYRARKEYDRALFHLGKITASRNSTREHFLLKGKIEELAGLEQKALASYSDGLKIDNTDLNLRKYCIEKAGALGLVREVEELFTGSQISFYKKEHVDFIFNYFDQLSYNSLFGRLAQAYGNFLDIYKNDPEILSQLQFYRADTLRQQGKLKRAEQLLRKLANFESSVTEALYRLTLNGIEDGDIEVSKIWYGAFENKIEKDSSSKKYKVHQERKAFLKIRILLAAGNLQDARHLIAQDSFSDSVVYKLEKELCWKYIERGNFSECEILLQRLQKGRQFDPEIVVINTIINNQLKKTIRNLPSQYDLVSGKQPIASRLLQVARVELRHKEYEVARQHLEVITDTIVGSLASQLLEAELSFITGDMDKAIDLYKSVYGQFAGERYFFKKWLVSESKRGNYKSGIPLLLGGEDTLQKIDGAAIYSDLSDDFEEVLLLARMLWGDKQLEKSLKVYELLLNPPVIDLLGERFEFEETYYHYFTKEKSIWNTLRYLLRTKPEIVADLMAPLYLVDNLGVESGKIVADYYELYRWQKQILNEYLARKAVVKRNYVIAERNYKRFLEEEEENIEGLADLASIYDRFGQYRKEAQVYEVMLKSGLASAEMEESIEKSSAKIRPHTGIEGNFLTKNGREGRVDFENINLGASLLFTPDLEKDITFLYLYNNYSQAENSETQSSFLLESSGTIELFSDTDFLFTGQAERLEGKAGTNFYYSIGLHSRLDDYFSSHIKVYKKKVTDTLDAVVDGIYSDGFEIGLRGETPVGLFFGGDYRHRYYNDSNSEDQFHAYSSYNIYGEDVHFSVQYDYRYLENSDSNEGTVVPDIGSKEDYLYWKPGEYSEHGMTVHFQHLIRGHYGSDGLKSYYSFDNSLGYEDYEDTQNLIYKGEFYIFLEMSPHYLLKGNLVYLNSDEYEEKSMHFSLLYRW